MKCRMYDPKQLESLSYKPECDYAECLPKNPIKTGFLGLNTHIIKPANRPIETKVNKAEAASQDLCNKCGGAGTYNIINTLTGDVQSADVPCPDCKPNPNQQLTTEEDKLDLEAAREAVKQGGFVDLDDLIKELPKEPNYYPLSCDEPEQPASAPPATLGMNSHVIRPELKINKVEDAGQHLQESLCGETEPEYEDVNGRPGKAYKKIPEQPNEGILANPEPSTEVKNIQLITEIEGLMSQVNEKLENLPIHAPELYNMRTQALEEINKFKTTLRKLKSSFTSE